MKNPLLLVKLVTAVYWFDEALQTALHAAGWQPVTRAQSMVFANVAVGVHRPSRLAKNLGISRQAVSQTLAELAARNLVVVEPDPSDKRAQYVRFTPESEPLRKAADMVLQSLEDELRSRIGVQAFNGLKAGLLADWGAPPVVRLISTDLPAPEPASALSRPRARRRTAGGARGPRS